jgi:hypothetical protein
MHLAKSQYLHASAHRSAMHHGIRPRTGRRPARRFLPLAAKSTGTTQQRNAQRRKYLLIQPHLSFSSSSLQLPARFSLA